MYQAVSKLHHINCHGQLVGLHSPTNLINIVGLTTQYYAAKSGRTIRLYFDKNTVIHTSNRYAINEVREIYFAHFMAMKKPSEAIRGLFVGMFLGRIRHHDWMNLKNPNRKKAKV